MDTSKLIKDVDTLYSFIDAYHPRRNGNRLYRVVSFPLTADRQIDYAKMRDLIKKRKMKNIVDDKDYQLRIKV